MSKHRKTISHGYLYVGKVLRDDNTGQVNLVVGRDQDVFEISEGTQFVTFVTPESLFPEDQNHE